MNLKVMSLPLSALALALGALPAGADWIKLADGSRIDGVTTGYDEDRLVLSFRSRDGRQLEFGLDELDQRSVYRVKRGQAACESALGQLQIAHYARDIGLFAHAARHYDKALEADPDLRPRVEAGLSVLRHRAADECMDQAREALESGDLERAEKWLTRLVSQLPEEPLAVQAAQILDGIYTEVHAAREREQLRERAERLDRELADERRLFQRMVDRNKDALMNTRSGSQAVRSWERAVRDGERALKGLDGVAAEYPDDELRESVRRFRELVTQQIVETRMNLANHYMGRQAYTQAQEEVNLALALVPEHAEANAMRVRIENAMSRGVLWWPGLEPWRRGGRQ